MRGPRGTAGGARIRPRTDREPGRRRETALAVGAALALIAAAASPAAAQQDPAPDTAPDVAPDTAAAAVSGPGQATGRRGHAFLGGYALLAFDRSSGTVGAVSASSGFSAGSGSLVVQPDRGAAVLLGSGSEPARRAAVESLRGGAGAGETATRAISAAGRPRGLQVSTLTTDCARSTQTSGDAYPWTGAREGDVGDVCFLAAGAFLADPTVVDRMSAAFGSAEGSLLDRLQTALAAAEDAAGDVARSRSAAIWISAPDAESGPLGRPHLRLQVEDVQRPADALRSLIRAGRAEALARRASVAVDAGRHARAIELADGAVELDPATPLAWLARGRALLYRNQDEDAEEAFRRMLEINPHLLHLLGDPSTAARDTADASPTGAPDVREDLIPYRPRLLLRLDEYRRAFFREVEFPEREEDAPGEGPPDEGGGGSA